MSAALKWDKKDVWRVAGREFSIEVSRHSVNPRVYDVLHDYRDGGNRWAVYAYIYPKHELSPKFKASGSMFDQPELPLHCGVSFFKAHWDSGEIKSYQIGADYNHLYDDDFTKYETKDDATRVFYDAEKLHEFLSTPTNGESK